ncbi:MAG TPA: discoidin domain-containing protein [Actinophytocola sp.]|uniref:discoidin domain-containing protein n=1 Tax=Actinophytocola sp. TaxID=1872138 RepID=UPI002DB7EC40|nr:discoidin domain-containing protein [Actinophytocola sp.]HEU5473410.1 discoidin domain-containing protein [Actinophytocola sp.]
MRTRPRLLPRRGSVFTIAAALVAGLVIVPGVATAAPTLLSQNKPASASSTENAGTPASAAVDGNPATRWSSAFGDPQWVQVDLGGRATINQVNLSWEAAYARAFQIQVSDNAASWTTVFSTTTGTGGTQNLAVSGSGRYVRMLGTARATAFGYSLWEFQVIGELAGSACGNNVALNRPAAASSTENAATPASAAVDGNPATRWSSAFVDPQWLRVDLGAPTAICQVVLSWEAAYATAFQIQVSNDASAWTTIFATTTGTGGTQTLAVNGTGRYVRMNGTVRATGFGYSLWEFGVFGTGGPPPPPPPPDQFWGDTSTIPPANNVLMVKVLNRTNGRYPDSQVFWSFNGQVRSIAEQPFLDMPANSAGRMNFFLGSPNSQYFDFIEFTVGPAVFNGNTTRVDAFGLKLAMRLHARDGFDVEVGEDRATFAEDRSATFAKFVAEVPAQFDVLAQSPGQARIIAPGSDPTFRAGGVNANYFTAYANSVGVNASTSDIFGCAGPLAADPDMCAALNRHTAHLPRAQWGDPARYYPTAPANYYAKFWHDHAISRLAYGFPYDDVANQSSFISHGNPQWLLVAVGW